MANEFLHINETDYIELYVGNAKQAAYFYMTAFGFQPLAYKGLETGEKESTSYVVAQEKIRLVLTTALIPDSPIANHVRQHGDGVKVIALAVDDARSAFEETVKRGAAQYLEPVVEADDFGKVVFSGIRIYGETVHVFVERKNYKGPFLPGYITWEPGFKTGSVGLKHVDHMVGNVDWGEMDKWAEYYCQVLGFHQLITFEDKDISTEYSALRSKVVADRDEYIKYPINEPAKGKKKSQIEEYIDFYGTPGVQHIAMASDDIIKSVEELQHRGVEFLEVPDAYYEEAVKRVGKIDENIDKLRQLKILLDRDEYGYLLQIFTKPVEDRPTLFFEVIQRKGARTFGKGNFKALFEAVEREQQRRGTL